MPLLLLPLAVLLLLVVAAASPLVLWRRHRTGRAWRTARGWHLSLMAWTLLPAIPMVLVGAWLAQRWVPHAGTWALCGIAIGSVLAWVRVATMKVERGMDGIRYAPDPWVPLGLALLVAGKLVWVVWAAWRGWRGAPPVDAWWASRVVFFGLGGLLSGHAVAHAWGVRWRLSGARRRRVRVVG